MKRFIFITLAFVAVAVGATINVVLNFQERSRESLLTLDRIEAFGEESTELAPGWYNFQEVCEKEVLTGTYHYDPYTGKKVYHYTKIDCCQSSLSKDSACNVGGQDSRCLSQESE